MSHASQLSVTCWIQLPPALRTVVVHSSRKFGYCNDENVARQPVLVSGFVDAVFSGDAMD